MLAVVASFLLPGPRPASAQCAGFDDIVSTSVRVSRSSQNIDSPTVSGHPATIDFGHTFATPNLEDLGGRAQFAIDNGGLSASIFAGGYTITGGTTSVATTAYGNLFDCIGLSGGAGFARVHLPFHLGGASASNWVLNGGSPMYPQGVTPAATFFTIDCFVFDYGVTPAAPVACADLALSWSTDVPLDEDGEFTWIVAFDRPFLLNLQVKVTSVLQYIGGNAPGQLTGSSSAGLSFPFGAAYVTDVAGSPLPSAVLSAASGYDYANPVPEAPSALAQVATWISLLGLRRSRRPSVA